MHLSSIPLVVSLFLHDEIIFLIYFFLYHRNFLLGDVAAEKAIERAAKDVRDQIAKGAADCKLND